MIAKVDKNGFTQSKYVYYSPNIDEIFTLPIKPEDPTLTLRLFFENTELLSHVIYLGEL
jgi:hypothetical protein